MELRPLRALVEVVRQGGFSQAAKTIHATQPTVSKAIKQLEDELGMPLLDRQVYPPRLTEAGEIVYRRALSMLAERDDLRAELDAARPAARRAAPGPAPAGQQLAVRALVRALSQPLSAHRNQPGGNTGSRRLEEMVMAGEIELAATLRPVPDNFDWQPVAREPLIALMPADHPRRRGRSRPRRTARHALHSVRDGFRVEPHHPGCLPARGLHAHRRGAQRADRLHRRPGRRRPGRGLPAAHQGRRGNPRRRQPRAVARSRHRLGNGAGLAARRLSFTRRKLIGADARSTSNHDIGKYIWTPGARRARARPGML